MNLKSTIQSYEDLISLEMFVENKEITLENLFNEIKGGGIKAQDNFSKRFTKLLKDSLKGDEKFGKIEL